MAAGVRVVCVAATRRYRRRRRKEKKEKPSLASSEPTPDPRVRGFMAWYGAEHERRFRVPYVASFGADGKALKGVLAALDGKSELVGDPLVALREAAGRFFADDWPRQFGGYTLRNLCGQINRYLAGQNGGASLLPPEPR